MLSVLLLSLPWSLGCSSGGDDGSGGNGGEEVQALTLDGSTSIPATGGSSIAVDHGRGLASVLSSMLQALVDDLEAPPEAAQSKLLVDEALPLCSGGGTALLSGELVIGGDGTAALVFTNCEGSPLSSAATNGRLELTASTSLTSDPVNPFITILGRGVLAGLEEGEDFTIEPSTILAGGFGVDADLPIEFSPGLQATAIRSLTLSGDSPSADPPRTIQVRDSEGRLELGCFELTLSNVVFDPPSVGPLTFSGVLNLDGSIYTVRSSDIGFDDLSSGTAVPTSGDLTLTGGDSTDCFGVVATNRSRATASFTSGGKVLIDTFDPPSCYECEESWESLLQILRTTVAPTDCPSKACSNSPPVINWVAWEYTDGCTGFGDTVLTVTVSAYDNEDDALTYTGSVFTCLTPISEESTDSPVEILLDDCFSGTIETVMITVEDSEGATDSLSTTWESALCEEFCEEGDEDELIEDECPSPWPDD
jgi:hypothetical protein